MTTNMTDIRRFMALCEKADGMCVDPDQEMLQYVADHPWIDRYLTIYNRTEAACEALGHQLGFNPWLLSSIEAFDATPRLLVLGLNPGGAKDQPGHRGRFRFEDANAYLTIWDETGFSLLQQQVQRLIEQLRVRMAPDVPLDEFARRRTVTGSLVPFRSSREATLHRREESLAFGRDLWRTVFSHWHPAAAVVFGATPLKEISALLGPVIDEQAFPTGWGDKVLTLRIFASGTRVLGTPHLSQFRVFGRPQGAAGIASAFDALLQEARP